MGLLERIQKKAKTLYGLIAFLILIGSPTYLYTKNIPVTIITVILMVLIIVIWDMYETLTGLKDWRNRHIKGHPRKIRYKKRRR